MPACIEYGEMTGMFDQGSMGQHAVLYQLRGPRIVFFGYVIVERLATHKWKGSNHTITRPSIHGASHVNFILLLRLEGRLFCIMDPSGSQLHCLTFVRELSLYIFSFVTMDLKARITPSG